MSKANPLFNQYKKADPAQARLTPKQKVVFEFIQEFSGKHGYAPSNQEIAKHFGFSSLGTVQNYLVRLEKQGVLAKTWNAKRSLQALTSPDEGLELPLLGRVAAGRPIEAFTSGETIEIPKSMKVPGELFGLRVQGNSMIEDGIMDGDYVIIRKQAQAENGQTVVAMINNEATIKRYYRRPTHVELHPANSEMKPILVDPGDHLRIEGVLVGVLRHF